MTWDKELFRDLNKSKSSKIGIGDGKLLSVDGIGTVAIESCTGTKLIADVLFVPEIRNLLSVGQLLEKGFKVIFENKNCLIKEPKGKEVFKVKMTRKSFLLNPLKEEHVKSNEKT